jgi:hypothetical protein
VVSLLISVLISLGSLAQAQTCPQILSEADLFTCALDHCFTLDGVRGDFVLWSGYLGKIVNIRAKSGRVIKQKVMLIKDIPESAQSRVKFLIGRYENIEGAFLEFRTKDGRVFYSEDFTSNIELRVRLSDIGNELRKTLAQLSKDEGIKRSDIQSVIYFHNHPTKGISPVSDSDEDAIGHLMRNEFMANGFNIQYGVYAIPQSRRTFGLAFFQSIDRQFMEESGKP